MFRRVRRLAHRFDREVLFEIAMATAGHHLDDARAPAPSGWRHHVDCVGQIRPRAGNPGTAAGRRAAFVPTSTRHTGHFRGEGIELINHRVDGVLQLEDFRPSRPTVICAEVAAARRRCHLGDVAHLSRQWRRAGDVVGQVFQVPATSENHGLTAEPAFGADPRGRTTGHLRRETSGARSTIVFKCPELEDLAPRHRTVTPCDSRP